MEAVKRIKKEVIKPFNHTPASSFFRLACRVDFAESDGIEKTTKQALLAFKQFEEYSKNLKGRMRKRTNNVRGRRKSIERLRKIPFKTLSGHMLYGVAIEIERILERHYQIKSGETYVVLTKSAMQLYEAVVGRIAPLLIHATINLNKEEANEPRAR